MATKMDDARPDTVNTKVVVALDFGTTCTGYAYYYKTGSRDYLDSINYEQSWTGAANVSMQAPTTVLMTPDKKFHSFGCEAEKKYESLALKNEHRDWFFFRHFKMELHHKHELKRDMSLKDDKGRSMPAIIVFEYAIRYTREHLEKQLNRERAVDLNLSDITWVITVPAIWRESAKAFMREAAAKAGIPNNKLVLALEPEAAAIFCKELASVQAKETKGGFPLQTFNPHKRYMILDLGGGTVDITVHEVLENGRLQELHAATGGAWGGQLVDNAFEDFMKNLVTVEVFNKFTHEHTRAWMVFCGTFEMAKRELSSEEEKSMLSFPPKLEEIFEAEKKMSLTEFIAKTHTSQKVELVENTLVLHKSVMVSFFSKAIDPICEHVKSLLERMNFNLDYLILVGGFSQSTIVKDRFEKDFGQSLRVIAPGGGGSAVLRGAVMFGIMPNIISSRISPYSYGVSTRKLFDPEVHANHRKESINGKDIVQNAFDVHIRKDEDIYVGTDNKKRKYTIVNPKRPVVFWNVYQSDKRKPLFCDEGGCRYIGKLKLNIPDKLLNESLSLEVWVKCLGTELVACATAKDGRKSGKEVMCTCQFDFLGDPNVCASDFVESVK